MNAPEEPWYLCPGTVVFVGTRDTEGNPFASRAVAVRRARDGVGLLAFVSMPQGVETLANVTATGHVAVCIARPDDYRTVQLKSWDARIVARHPDDEAFLAAAYDATLVVVASLGLDTVVMRRLQTLHGAVAVQFTPAGMWDQAPGAGAGRELPL